MLQYVLLPGRKRVSLAAQRGRTAPGEAGLCSAVGRDSHSVGGFTLRKLLIEIMRCSACSESG
jgi:hypothetical protein